MIRIGTTAATLCLVLAASVAFASASAAASLSPSISGFVKDELGKALEGVEVVVQPGDGVPGGKISNVVSDAGGRFLVGALAPGVYRIAAVKSGYTVAFGRVNTALRSSIDLVLRPLPKDGEPRVENVLPDLSWALRAPPRSVLRELGAGSVVASHETGGASAFVARVQDAVRGEVDHVFALGSWRAGNSGMGSGLSGNETRMRVSSNLGERGAIQVRGRRGTLDSSSGTTAGVSHGASDVDLDLSYDTGVDGSLAMRAFYSSGALEVDGPSGAASAGLRQSQRSFGYDASWHQQVDASSRVALQVGFQDSNLALGPADVAIGADSAAPDAWNRGIGAQGSYENLVGDSHLVRLGVRAQRLSLEAPMVRVGQPDGSLASLGAAGWNLLVDTADQWSIAAPVSLSYGLGVRQRSDGAPSTAMSPRVAAVWSSSRVEARLGVSYLAESHGGADPAVPDPAIRRSPYGYEMGLRTRLGSAVTLSGTAGYVPSRADAWEGATAGSGPQDLYVSDGWTSDRFVAVELARVAPAATIALQVARGRAEGVLASALDDVPVVLLSDRAMNYGTARLRVTAPRAGSAMSFGYRTTRDSDAEPGIGLTSAHRMLDMEFAQNLVRFAGGRASCRLLVTAKAALRSRAVDTEPLPYVGEDKRVGAGVSVGF